MGLSRWTDFLTTGGEKDNRNRDSEFENDIKSRADLLEKWNAGWTYLFSALNDFTENNLHKIIYIRNQGHTVLEAINRQLAHYPYHVGKSVFIGKLIANNNWKSLSIPKGHSKVYNDENFRSRDITNILAKKCLENLKIINNKKHSKIRVFFV